VDDNNQAAKEKDNGDFNEIHEKRDVSNDLIVAVCYPPKPEKRMILIFQNTVFITLPLFNKTIILRLFPEFKRPISDQIPVQ
jgi:hypothetical protein